MFILLLSMSIVLFRQLEQISAHHFKFEYNDDNDECHS